MRLPLQNKCHQIKTLHKQKLLSQINLAEAGFLFYNIYI